MSKTMGFRDSGKLDLGGKGMEVSIIVVLVAIVALAAVVIVRQFSCRVGGAIEAPEEYHVKCIKCGEEWPIPRNQVMNYQRETGPGVQSMGGDCPKCERKGCVFVMIPCPECGTHYLSKRVTDPEGVASGKIRDVCPKCGTDLIEWHKKRMKRR